MQQELLFVYGLLLNQEDHEVSRLVGEQTELLCHGYFHGQLYDVDWYPAATYAPNATNKVWGSILRIKDTHNTLVALDDFEGIGPNWEQPYEYERQQIKAFSATGDPITCWCYIYMYNTTELVHIPEGDYYAYRKLKDARQTKSS